MDFYSTSKRLLLCLCFFSLSATKLSAQVTIEYPKPFIVVQRNNQNEGTVYISGTLSQNADRVEARLLGIAGEATESTDTWNVIDSQVGGGAFLGQLTARGGRYNLEVRAVRNNEVVGNVAVVEKVGVGEVFLIVGHSNAQGDNGLTWPAESDRVVSMDIYSVPDFSLRYHPTADPEILPKDYTPLTAGRGISPFVGDAWFWGRFGDHVVQQLGVPVLLYSAAFGGSNMEHTAMSARGEQFDHGFIRWELRMPYINIENTLFHLVPKTGIRAILSAHGVNDAGDPNNGEYEGNKFYNNHKFVIDFSRQQQKLQNLTWMVAKACYRGGGVLQYLADAQERLIQLDNVFRGADLNSIGDEGRSDRLHFNEVGMALAAERWRDAVTQPDFLTSSSPIMPDRPEKPEGSLPVNLVRFSAREAAEGGIDLAWATAGEKDNDHFEVQYSSDARNFRVGGLVKGAGTTAGPASYEFRLQQSFPTGHAYLRLKQVDTDGSFDYSNIVAVQITSGRGDALYPNPSAGLVTVRLANHEQPEVIRVYDATGRLRYQAANTDQVDISALPVSAYSVEVTGKNGVVWVKRVVKM